MIVYDWGTQPGYLFFHLWPFARLFSASPEDTADELIERLGSLLSLHESFALHICLTHISQWPRQRERFCSWLYDRGNPIVNSELTDVSKRRVQCLNKQLGLPTTSVSRDISSESLVIVKTDRNYGGVSERRLSYQQRVALGISCEDSHISRFDAYEICSASKVDESKWSDPNLSIERFVRNDANVIYRCYLAGSHIVVSRAVNPRPIKKMLPGLQRQNWNLSVSEGRVDPEISAIVENSLRFRRAIGMDFGTLDVVVDTDEIPYIVDANPTPGWGDECQPELLAHLRNGFGTTNA